MQIATGTSKEKAPPCKSKLPLIREAISYLFHLGNLATVGML